MQYSVTKLRRLLVGARQTMNVMGTITHVRIRDPVAALTFDDGPDPQWTPRILDILERHQARATFFMVGEAAQRYPKLVQRVAQTGHAIGYHSWDHPSFPLITGSERRAQLRACAKAIAPYGRRTFRPPYGPQCVASRLDALWLGYQVVTWNLLAYDWLDHDENWMAKRLVRQIKPGSVILFHAALYHFMEERYTNREPMLEALNTLLEQVGDCFRLITVPELLRHGRPQRRNWYQNADIAWLNGLRRQEGDTRRYAGSSGRKCLAIVSLDEHKH